MYKSYVDYFDKTAVVYSDKTAVVEGDNSFSFFQIKEASLKIAQGIIRLGKDTQNKPVAVYLPKSANTIIADIGILYSGNAFMNLDVKMPLERLYAIFCHIKPEIIITDTANKGRIEESGVPAGAKILEIEKILTNEHCSEMEISLVKRRLRNQIDTDPSCIINTSGSTGVPKGVVLNHKSFIDFLEWATETFDLNENINIGSLSPSVFDIFVFEIWLMAYKGATITLLKDEMSIFPINLLKELNDKAVNFIFWVPSIMVNIANMDLLSKINLNTLKLVWFAGEVFPTKQFNYWKRNLKNTEFVNLYGPIEITLDCTYYIVDRELDDSEPIPIGFPCSNTDVLILNKKDEPCSIREEGELCVRGTSLAMGYYKDPEKTSRVFVQNPLNKEYPELIYRTGDVVYKNECGEIIFIGRKDSLIKHMGYRIELGEIEHAVINKLKIVRYCCAVYNYDKKEITLVYEANEDIDIGVFRKELLKIFPKYMLPVRYIRKELLPRNTNGKIDRNKLSEEVNQNDI